MTATTLQWIITALFLPALGALWYDVRGLSAKIDSYSKDLLHVAENAAIAKDRTERAASGHLTHQIEHDSQAPT